MLERPAPIKRRSPLPSAPRWLVLLALVTTGCQPSAPDTAGAPLRVLSASSLMDVLPALGPTTPAGAAASPTVQYSFDASSRLSRQLLQGAPADVIITADSAWMDHLQSQGGIAPTTRRRLATNRLAVIRAKGFHARADSLTTLCALSAPQLAIAGEHVPLGRYTRAALASIAGPCPPSDQAVEGLNARHVLRLVAQGHTELGIVYRTDAASTDSVDVLFDIPADSHPPIEYFAAATATSGRPSLAAAYVDSLLQPANRARLRDSGFTTDSDPGGNHDR